MDPQTETHNYNVWWVYSVNINADACECSWEWVCVLVSVWVLFFFQEIVWFSVNSFMLTANNRLTCCLYFTHKFVSSTLCLNHFFLQCIRRAGLTHIHNERTIERMYEPNIKRNSDSMSMKKYERVLCM